MMPIIVSVCAFETIYKSRAKSLQFGKRFRGPSKCSEFCLCELVVGREGVGGREGGGEGVGERVEVCSVSFSFLPLIVCHSHSSLSFSGSLLYSERQTRICKTHTHTHTHACTHARTHGHKIRTGIVSQTTQ